MCFSQESGEWDGCTGFDSRSRLFLLAKSVDRESNLGIQIVPASRLPLSHPPPGHPRTVRDAHWFSHSDDLCYIIHCASGALGCPGSTCPYLTKSPRLGGGSEARFLEWRLAPPSFAASSAFVARCARSLTASSRSLTVVARLPYSSLA